MSSEVIFFSVEDLDFTTNGLEQLKPWLKKIAKNAYREIESLSYMICSDNYLLEIHKKYLQKDSLTDIITFDCGELESSSLLCGDIYISLDRVKANSIELNQPFIKEFLRVVAHGLLHLLGYRDKTKQEQKSMRHQENLCLEMKEALLFINNKTIYYK